MKRSHSQVTSPLTMLPDHIAADQKVLKSTLEGSHRLRVTQVLDISKPTNKPIDEIEEPDEEDKALQNKLNKSNARMLQLQLEDSARNQIKAIETEMIKSLTAVKNNSVINIQGPVEIRCGNIMLQAKHILRVEEVKSEDIKELEPIKRQDIADTREPEPARRNDIEFINAPTDTKREYIEVVEEPEGIKRDNSVVKGDNQVRRQDIEDLKSIPLVDLDDDDFDDDEDDCIIIE